MPKTIGKRRLDQLLVERSLVESREKAQRLVLAGAVTVDGQIARKAGQLVAAACALSVTAPERFVSRGGIKLERALERFALTVEHKICLDIGASTGGFTDCLLQHGAARVIALDVGRGLLHWRLRQDARVFMIEGFNARYLVADDLPAIPDLVTVDVSFISLTLVLPAIAPILHMGGEVVTLIKPQFEAGRQQVQRGGVVRDQAVRSAIIEQIREFGVTQLGWRWLGVCRSPITGPAGNVEFLALWKKL